MSVAGVGRRPGAGASSGLPGPRQGGRWLALRPLSLARAIDDKYSRREEYRGFTQDFKEKDGYKPDVKIEYVDETGRKLTPKEVRASGTGPSGFHGVWAQVTPGWGPGELSEPLCLCFSLVGIAVPLTGPAGGGTGALAPLLTCPLSGVMCPRATILVAGCRPWTALCPHGLPASPGSPCLTLRPPPCVRPHPSTLLTLPGFAAASLHPVSWPGLGPAGVTGDPEAPAQHILLLSPFPLLSPPAHHPLRL